MTTMLLFTITSSHDVYIWPHLARVDVQLLMPHRTIMLDFLASVVVHLCRRPRGFDLVALCNCSYWLDPPWPDDAYCIWIVFLRYFVRGPATEFLYKKKVMGYLVFGSRPTLGVLNVLFDFTCVYPAVIIYCTFGYHYMLSLP